MKDTRSKSYTSDPNGYRNWTGISKTQSTLRTLGGGGNGLDSFINFTAAASRSLLPLLLAIFSVAIAPEGATLNLTMHTPGGNPKPRVHQLHEAILAYTALA